MMVTTMPILVPVLKAMGVDVPGDRALAAERRDGAVTYPFGHVDTKIPRCVE